MGSAIPRSLICAATASLFLNACQQSVDLDAVRKLAASTTAASASYGALAGDYYQSCLRTQMWREFDISVITKRRMSEDRAKPGPLPTLPPSSIPVNRQLPPEEQAKLAEIFTSKKSIVAELSCDGNQAASAQWQIWNQLLVSYIAALGNVAGGSKDDADFGMNQLTKSLQGTKLLATQAQSDALSKAANDVVGAMFEARRKGEIAKFAAGPGQAFIDTYVDRLQAVAKKDYQDAMLGSEEQALNAFFTDNLFSTRLGIETLSAVTYVSQWSTYRSALDQRKQATAAYVKSLGEIKHAHNELVQAIINNKTSEVARIVQTHLNEFGPDIAAINKAFK